MNVTDYTYLINKPNAITEKQTNALGKVLDEFPFFQSARALRLKGLFNENSFKYNYALKVTAAHTTDRTVLFDFITSNTFVAIQKGLYDKKVLELLDISVIDCEVIKPEIQIEPKTNKLEQSILTTIKEATPVEVAEKEIASNLAMTAAENLEIGKPLGFSKDEKHSFQEWLQLARTQPIEREINTQSVAFDEEKKKKIDLIDKFIETSPKISPIKHNVESTIQIDVNKTDNSYLMTETLARVYLEQKKISKSDTSL